MNVFCVVGQIEQLPSLKETANGIKTCNVMIKIEVWRGLAETIANVAQIDDLIAVKGRVASRKVIKDDRTFYNYAFVAEKIDFLSSKV